MSDEGPDNRSIHSDHIEEVLDIPMAAIRRPIPSVLENAKVDRFVDLLRDPVSREKITPIDVAWVNHEGKDYYYAFGGCHRWAAHKKVDAEYIRGKLIKVSPATINTYLGASSPFFSKTTASAKKKSEGEGEGEVVEAEVVEEEEVETGDVTDDAHSKARSESSTAEISPKKSNEKPFPSSSSSSSFEITNVVPIDVGLIDRLEVASVRAASFIDDAIENLKGHLRQYGAVTGESSEIFGSSVRDLANTLATSRERSSQLMTLCEELDEEFVPLRSLSSSLKNFKKMLDGLEATVYGGGC